MILNEGGNIFKDASGNPLTQRINQTDVKPTVAWLERVTGLPLLDNMLGSTGLKPTSGDLDLAVDATQTDKDDLFNRLTHYVQQQGQDPRQWVRKTGISVHFKTPIAGRAGTGFVQTDFMFVPKVSFAKWYMRQDANSDYKGATRAVLINSIAKSMGLKLNPNAGIENRQSGELLTDDPAEIARMLLNPKATEDDLYSVEKILAALKNDPKRDAKLADFRDHMQRNGMTFEESVEETDVSVMARLRDRIVNQGMQVIVEAARIEHPEDLVFDAGSRGLKQALDGILKTAANPQTATVKWDGKPAIVFGRKPTGEFVLTDKAGFTSKSYDGLATSPEHIARMMSMRKGERSELISMYQKLFPLLRASVPTNFRGYLQGDLLFSQTPPVIDGAYEFVPNTVKYRVSADSDLGKKISSSQVGLVIHTAIAAPGEQPRPTQAAVLQPVKGLLVLDPSLREPRKIQLNDRMIADAQKLISQYGTSIDRLFDPQELRARKISDMPMLIKQYINSRVRSGSYENLVAGFGQWVQQKAPAKAPRIFAWATENKQAVAALFQAFLEISSLKNELVRQLDAQGHDVQASVDGEPGHEGYVGNNVKFVDRMRFSSANFAKNNPELA